MQAVLLAAGYGLRLRPLTETTPKGLLPIAGKPLLTHTLEALPAEVDEVYFVIGHLGEQIQSYFGTEFAAKKLHYAVQDPVNGTGTALQVLKDVLHGTFLALNGDDLYAAEDLQKLIQQTPSALITETTKPVAFPVAENKNHQFIKFNPPLHGEPALVISGAYCLNTNFFDYPLGTVEVHGHTEYSLPHTLEAMAHDHPINLVHATSWTPIGTPEEYELAQNVIQK